MGSLTFLARVSEAIDHDGILVPGQSFDGVENWDSLGILSIVDLLEEMGVEVDIDALSTVDTTDALIALAGSAINGWRRLNAAACLDCWGIKRHRRVGCKSYAGYAPDNGASATD